MGEEESLVGYIAQSIQGRDAGNIYLVWQEIDENYLLLVDGNARKFSNPKKKKKKHLSISNVVLDNLRSKILEGKKIFDAEVFSNLKKVENTKIMED